MENQAEKAINGYVSTNPLKERIRGGWEKNYNINKARLESIAEHTYGVTQLAIFMYLSYPEKYNHLDIFKVITMLSIHDVAEAFRGDKTITEKTNEDEKFERTMMHVIYSSFENGELFENLYKEFEEKQTPEAKFAHMCDKIEAGLQATIYSEEGYVDMSNLEDKPCMKSSLIRSLVNQGLTLGQVFAQYSIERDGLDEQFTEVAQYMKANKILPKEKQK
jgi:5'-deoxynucleotidase YfbR-like HD superfamily hydrolase